jgi:L-arabinose transport system substrate-binding protein
MGASRSGDARLKRRTVSMKRNSTLLATSMIAIAIVASVAGCSAAAGGSASAGGGKIAYISKDLSQGYFQTEAAGVKKQAKASGYTAIIMDSRNDANTQSSNLDTAVTQGAKGVVLVTQDQKLGPAVAAKLAAAKIPLVTVDDPIVDANGKAVPFVGMDTKQIGTDVGQLLSDSMKKKGWNSGDTAAASITYDQIDVCQQRTDATKAALVSKLPDLSKANYYNASSADNSTDGGLQAMQGLITAHPNVKHWLVYGCNEEGVVGSVRALEAAGQSASSCGVGLGDGSLAKIEFAKGTADYCGSLYVNSAKHGEMAVKLIADFNKTGKKIPAQTLVPGTEVTVENWKTIFGK